MDTNEVHFECLKLAVARNDAGATAEVVLEQARKFYGFFFEADPLTTGAAVQKDKIHE